MSDENELRRKILGDYEGQLREMFQNKGDLSQNEKAAIELLQNLANGLSLTESTYHAMATTKTKNHASLVRTIWPILKSVRTYAKVTVGQKSSLANKALRGAVLI